MSTCSAPWYELNLSAPDDNVSACCYYSAERDPYEPASGDIFHYWNSASMQKVRAINAGQRLEGRNGCANCHYFQNQRSEAVYFDFANEPQGLSPAQKANWLKAKDAFLARSQIVSSTPLRIYANFGYMCNLACTMCHQVPRRVENKRALKASQLLQWRDALRSALSVDVIGGEPFALPEALSFIREFSTDDEFAAVRLTIMTNGTVHHKHLNFLRKKEKLDLVVSLDAVGPTYDKLRVNGKWEQIERGIVDFLEIARTQRPQWRISTNAAIHKSSVAQLPDFASWHVKHGISTWFYDFINAETWRHETVINYGTDDTFRGENILEHPQLLDRVDGWRDHFTKAIQIFRDGGMEGPAGSLESYYDKVRKSYDTYASNTAHPLRRLMANAWTPALETKDMEAFTQLFTFHGRDPERGVNYSTESGYLKFGKMRVGDHFATKYFEVDSSGKEDVGIRLFTGWSTNHDGMRRARIHIQRSDSNYLAVTHDVREFDDRVEEYQIGSLSPGVNKLRLVVSPVGEGEGVVPDHIRLDFDDPTLTDVKFTRPVDAVTEPIVGFSDWKIPEAVRQRLGQLGRAFDKIRGH